MQRDRGFFLAPNASVESTSAEANAPSLNPVSPDRDSRKPRTMLLDSAMQATQHAAASAHQAAAQAAAHARAVYAFDWVDWAGRSGAPDAEGSGVGLVEQSAAAITAEEVFQPERVPKRSALKGAREATRARETAALANASNHPQAPTSSSLSATATTTNAPATCSKEAAVAAAEALEAAKTATMAARAAAAISSLRPPEEVGLSTSSSVFGNSSIINNSTSKRSSGAFDFAEYDRSDTMTADAAKRLAQQRKRASAASGGVRKSEVESVVVASTPPVDGHMSSTEEEEDAATRAAALMRFRRGQCYEHGLGGVNKSIKVCARARSSIFSSCVYTAFE